MSEACTYEAWHFLLGSALHRPSRGALSHFGTEGRKAYDCAGLKDCTYLEMLLLMTAVAAAATDFVAEGC